MDDAAVALDKAVEIARESLAGRITPLETGQLMIDYIDPWHPTWEALNGSFGPLVAFHVAAEALKRLYCSGDDVALPSVSTEAQRRAVARAEASMAAKIHDACHALIEYAASQRVW
jgi:hypothetical protein